MYCRNELSFDNLFIELLLKIFSYLTPEQIIALALVSKHFTSIYKDNFLWKEKFQIHFPHLMNELTDKKEIHWYTEFVKAYGKEYAFQYQGKPFYEHGRLFSLAKENSIPEIKLLKHGTRRTDNKERTLFYWIKQKNNQPFLDNCYQKIKEEVNNRLSKEMYVPIFNGWSLLDWAVFCYQDEKEVGSLLATGYSLDTKDNEFIDLSSANKGKRNAIHLAAQVGNINLLKFFLEMRPDLLEKRDKFRMTALYLAAENGHTEAVRLLIQKGANLNSKSSIESFGYYVKKTALHAAAEEDYSEVVTLLLQVGALITREPKYYFHHISHRHWPIHIAVQKGYLNTVKAFLQHNPEFVESLNEQGYTPLLFATIHEQIEIVNYLISKKANLNVVTQVNENGYEWDNISSSKGRTPLHWAVVKKNMCLVRLLINAGADSEIMAIDDNRREIQPIHIAVNLGREDIVKELLQHNMSLLNQYVDKNGDTLLMFAIKGYHPKMIKFLLKYEIDNKEINKGILFLEKNYCDNYCRGIKNSLKKHLSQQKLITEVKKVKQITFASTLKDKIIEIYQWYASRYSFIFWQKSRYKNQALLIIQEINQHQGQFNKNDFVKIAKKYLVSEDYMKEAETDYFYPIYTYVKRLFNSQEPQLECINSNQKLNLG